MTSKWESDTSATTELNSMLQFYHKLNLTKLSLPGYSELELIIKLLC